MAILAAGMLMLSACKEGDSYDMANVQSNIQSAGIEEGNFFGEWSVNGLVVDTARLQVSDKLIVRLPETYLAHRCFSQNSTDNHASDIPDTDKAEEGIVIAQNIKLLGQPAKIRITNQGYTSAASYSNIDSATEETDGKKLFRPAYFLVTVEGVMHLVELLSDENGNAVFMGDTLGWTIAIYINGFRIINTETMETHERFLDKRIELYYNTKERIYKNSGGNRTSAA